MAFCNHEDPPLSHPRSFAGLVVVCTRIFQIDPSIRLDWGSGVPGDVSRVGSTGGSVGVRWDGYLKARLSEEFTFAISMRAGDEAR